jgi:hypothetical protein
MSVRNGEEIYKLLTLNECQWRRTQSVISFARNAGRICGLRFFSPSCERLDKSVIVHVFVLTCVLHFQNHGSKRAMALTSQLLSIYIYTARPNTNILVISIDRNGYIRVVINMNIEEYGSD